MKDAVGIPNKIPRITDANNQLPIIGLTKKGKRIKTIRIVIQPKRKATREEELVLRLYSFIITLLSALRQKNEYIKFKRTVYMIHLLSFLSSLIKPLFFC